jgi:recombination protein RecT
LNGFKKAVYWTVDMIKEHANKFSKNTSGTFWGKNFDAMGRKTVLKTMLSTYGTLAPAISTAVEYDMQTITPEDIDEGQGNNNTNKV